MKCLLDFRYLPENLAENLLASERNGHIFGLQRHIAMSFAHLTLATRDVEATASFFASTVGWQRIDRPGNIGRPAAWLEIAPGQELHVVQVPDFEISAFDQEFGRHVAINLPLAEFPALKAQLIENGGSLIAPIRETPFERFFFRDPNGYLFEVVAAERNPEV